MKFGLIGCGRIAKRHVEAALMNQLEIVAVCDVSAESVDKLLDENGLTNKNIRKYTDYRQMIDENELKLVAIATASGSHAEIAEYCIERGLNVIIEKPISMSMRDVNYIVKLAEDYDIKVTICNVNRLQTSVQQVRAALDNGKFATMSHGSVHVRWNRGMQYYLEAPWRGTWEADGGTLMNQCIHSIDLLLWMMGDAEEVYGVSRNRFHGELESDDVSMAVIKFKSGAIGTIEGTTNVYPKNLEETLYLFGETGTVKLGGKSTDTVEVWDFTDGSTPEDDLNTRYGFRFGKGHVGIYGDIIDAVKNNRKPYIDVYAGRDVVELILAIYKSAKTGQPVKLPLDDFATVDMKR